MSVVEPTSESPGDVVGAGHVEGERVEDGHVGAGHVEGERVEGEHVSTGHVSTGHVGTGPFDDDRVEVPAGRRAALVIALVAGLIFAWSVYAALGNVIQVPQSFDLYRDFVTKNGAPELAKATPWAALVAALLVPVVGYLAALRLGRGRSVVRRVIVFVLAYAAVSAVTVSLTAYVFQQSSLL